MKFFAIASRLALSATFAALAACSDKDHDSPAAPAAGPDAITISRPALYPESMAYDDAGGRFLVGSLATGALGQVQADGSYAVFADDARLVSTTGVLLDAPRNRVLAAVGDLGGNPARTSAATQYKLAGLASFDRATGQLLAYADLSGLRPGGAHFGNDVAVDGEGNAYVTDSFAPILYKVDLQGRASVFLEDPRLAAPAGSFGLNGIVFHPDGYLLVGKYDEGALYKVPLANPAAFARVASAASFASADGLLLADRNTLLIAANGQTNAVLRVRTADNWASAAADGSFATGNVFPTALARRHDDVYVLESHLDALLSGQNPPVAQFALRKAKL